MLLDTSLSSLISDFIDGMNSIRPPDNQVPNSIEFGALRNHVAYIAYDMSSVIRFACTLEIIQIWLSGVRIQGDVRCEPHKLYEVIILLADYSH